MSKTYRIYKVVGENIRFERQRQEMTIEQLALKSGVAAKNLGVLERGERNPTLRTLYRIARGLRIPTYILLCSKKKANQTASLKPKKETEAYNRIQSVLGDRISQLTEEEWRRVADFIDDKIPSKNYTKESQYEGDKYNA